MIPLCVLSEKGKKEEVSKVVILPGFDCPELLVEGYSRDPSILKYSNSDMDSQSNSRSLATLHAENEEGRKLLGFAKYLKERGKVGIAKHDRNTIYLLPPTSLSSNDGSSAVKIRCLIATKNREPLASTQPSSSAIAGTATQAKPKPSGLLGALASKMSGTEAARTALMNKKDKDIRDRTMNYITRMETELKIKLQEFADDPEQKVLRLEPMEKDYRYVVHDVVGLFETLLSASCGEMDDRHVVIYKKGHEVPEGVELHVSKDEMRAATMGHAAERDKASKKVEDARYKADLRKLQAVSTKLNVHKRDRRSIEELEAEVKERKKAKALE